MKHAIIVGHPDEDSFTLSVARTYAAAAEALGHEAVVRDLYRMGFDPCLKAGERPQTSDPRVGEDVLRERTLLSDAEVFVFVYPIWFGMPPAIVKGYIDRVFGQGFAFDGFHAGRAEPLLRGRSLISFTSSGSTSAWLSERGVRLSLETVFDDYVAALWGVRVVDHVHFASVVPFMDKRWVLENLATVEARVAAHFGPQAAKTI